MFDIIIRKGDTLPKIQKTIYVNGEKFPLNGYSVKFKISSIDGTELLDKPADITDEANGVVEYQWTAQDSTDVGDNAIVFARFEATDGSDGIFTVPNNRPLSIMLTTISRHEYSYSGDPQARDLDKVRFLISDTNMDKPLFTDSEIEFLLAEYKAPYAAAAEAAFVQSSRYTNMANKTVGPLSIDYGSFAERWSALAKSLMSRASRATGAVAISTQTERSPYFRLGHMDSPVSRSLAEWNNLLGSE